MQLNLTLSSLFSMKSSSMLTASILTPMYSVELCCTFGARSTSRQGRGRLPSRLTTWLRERQDGIREPVLGKGLMKGDVLYLWNSCVPSSPSVWIIRQCLRIAASLLDSAASSFRQCRKTHLDLDRREFIYNICLKFVATSTKAKLLFYFSIY